MSDNIFRGKLRYQDDIREFEYNKVTRSIRLKNLYTSAWFSWNLFDEVAPEIRTQIVALLKTVGLPQSDSIQCKCNITNLWNYGHESGCSERK